MWEYSNTKNNALKATILSTIQLSVPSYRIYLANPMTMCFSFIATLEENFHTAIQEKI